MTVSLWQADGTQPTHAVDFLVIGGGLVGSAAAYFAAQAGHTVTLVEAQDLAMGASGRNAGFMITGPDTYYHHAIARYGHDVTREIWQLSQRTHAIWHMLAEGASVPMDQCGSLLLAESSDEAAELRLAAEALHADGIDVIYHKRDPLNRGYFAAIEQPWDCAVQPAKLVETVFRRSGAALVNNSPVYAIEQTDTDRVIVHSRRVTFHARHVLLCTNAYSPLLHPYFKGKITPTRAQVFVTEPLPKPLINTCGYSDYGYMYYRTTFDGRLLMGGGRKDFKALENDTTDDRITPEVQTRLEEYTRRHYPEAVGASGQVKVSRRWAGIMGFTADGLPLVGRLPDMPGVGFAVGFTGHGLALGAGTAERAVRLLLHGDSPGAVDARRLEQIMT
ncbi:MAG: NAD(P)/FAD-dependent oxidoreductase [Chloroflexota bacterium]